MRAPATAHAATREAAPRAKEPPRAELDLQRQVGNRAVMQLLHARDAIAAAATTDDGAERAADTVAAHVLQPSAEPRDIGPRDGGARVPSPLGAGRALDAWSRSYFEPRFGCDLGDVRIHDDRRAEHMAAGLRARAFTLGSDIYFGPNELSSTATGVRLLAHELAHVVQQRVIGARVQRAPQPAGDAAADAALGQQRVDMAIQVMRKAE